MRIKIEEKHIKDKISNLENPDQFSLIQTNMSDLWNLVTKNRKLLDQSIRPNWLEQIQLCVLQFYKISNPNGSGNLLQPYKKLYEFVLNLYESID